VSRRGLLLLPLGLLLTIAGVTYGLAKWHPAKPGVPHAGGSVVVGDQYRGETVFTQTCSGCHGQGGQGGGIGPKLAGAPISVAAVKAQIDAGGGTMPAALVKGQDEQDVLAYVATIVAPSGS
jgi:mono/diheme cytochrome c family protein